MICPNLKRGFDEKTTKVSLYMILARFTKVTFARYVARQSPHKLSHRIIKVHSSERNQKVCPSEARNSLTRFLRACQVARQTFPEKFASVAASA
jgi:hypothetical protein